MSQPAAGRSHRIIVVGAGLSGLVAARLLHDRGHVVQVLERGRGPGGRMSTRIGKTCAFDHGAQYFTARDRRFRRHVLAWLERGLVARWEGAIGSFEDGAWRQTSGETERFVGVPGMNEICKSLADELPEVRYQCAVDAAQFEAGAGWTVTAAGQELQADMLILAMPPDQAQRLVGSQDLGKHTMQVAMQPVWALMARCGARLLKQWDGAFVNNHPLTWMARQPSKPGRGKAEAWIAHASPAWSAERLNADPLDVAREMQRLVEKLPGVAASMDDAEAHRWRFAIAKEPLDVGALWYPDQSLAVAGDWCAGSRVEGAFLSGQAAAAHVIAASRQC